MKYIDSNLSILMKRANSLDTARKNMDLCAKVLLLPDEQKSVLYDGLHIINQLMRDVDKNGMPKALNVKKIIMEECEK